MVTLEAIGNLVCDVFRKSFTAMERPIRFYHKLDQVIWGNKIKTRLNNCRNSKATRLDTRQNDKRLNYKQQSCVVSCSYHGDDAQFVSVCWPQRMFNHLTRRRRFSHNTNWNCTEQFHLIYLCVLRFIRRNKMRKHSHYVYYFMSNWLTLTWLIIISSSDSWETEKWDLY